MSRAGDWGEACPTGREQRAHHGSKLAQLAVQRAWGLKTRVGGQRKAAAGLLAASRLWAVTEPRSAPAPARGFCCHKRGRRRASCQVRTGEETGRGHRGPGPGLVQRAGEAGVLRVHYSPSVSQVTRPLWASVFSLIEEAEYLEAESTDCRGQALGGKVP